MATQEDRPNRVRLVGYTRVSTEEQGLLGAGMEAQRRSIEQECERKGWELLRIEEDVMSGKSTRLRTGLARALASCSTGEADGIIGAKLDRLTRSLLDFAGLLERAQREGWTLVLVEQAFDLGTPHGRAMGSMLAVFAQLERDLISERTKSALAIKRSQGVRLGRPPSLGEEVRRTVLALRSEDLSLGQIATRLNDMHIHGSHGGSWHKTSVRRVIVTSGG